MRLIGRDDQHDGDRVDTRVVNVGRNVFVGGARVRLACGRVGAGELVATVRDVVGMAARGTELVAI